MALINAVARAMIGNKRYASKANREAAHSPGAVYGIPRKINPAQDQREPSASMVRAWTCPVSSCFLHALKKVHPSVSSVVGRPCTMIFQKAPDAKCSYGIQGLLKC